MSPPGAVVRERRNGRAGRRPGCADSATSDEQCHPRKIFVGGLAHDTTTQHLRDYFWRYGTVVDAVVLRWPDGRSRGFGYVTFADATAASAALTVTHQLGGRAVDVKRAVPGTNKLFVGGLPQNTTAAELRERFEHFGVVSDAVVMIDPATNRSRGFGFICFLPGHEGAQSVTATLAEYENHRIRGKWIEVKSAAPPHKLVGKDGTNSPQTTGTLPSSNSSESGETLSSDGRMPAAPARAGAVKARGKPECGRRQVARGKVADLQPLGSPRKVDLSQAAFPSKPSGALSLGAVGGTDPTAACPPPGLFHGVVGNAGRNAMVAARASAPPATLPYSFPWGLPPTPMASSLALPPGLGVAPGADAAALAAFGSNPMSFGLGLQHQLHHLLFWQSMQAQFLEKNLPATAPELQTLEAAQVTC